MWYLFPHPGLEIWNLKKLKTTCQDLFMQDFHRTVRKCPALSGQWKWAQYKEKSLLCTHDTLWNQLWSCLILGTRPPKAWTAASCQCYIQVITHLDMKSTFSCPEAPTPHSSHQWASRAEADQPFCRCLQVWIGSLICSKASCSSRRWSSVQSYHDELQHPQEHRKTDQVHP